MSGTGFFSEANEKKANGLPEGGLPSDPHGAKVPKLPQIAIPSLLAGALALSITARSFGNDHATATLVSSSSNAAECPSLGQLAVAVEDRLGRRLFVPASQADLRVTLAYGQVGGEWYADVGLQTSSGQPLGDRRVSSSSRDCSAIEEALALVVALMVDLPQREVASRAAPAAPVISTTSSEVRVPARRHEARRYEATRWMGVVALSGVGSLGQLPKTGWGLQLAAALRSRSIWSAELGLLAFAPVTLTDGAATEARFSSYGAQVGMCVLGLRNVRSELRLCGGPRLGFEQASGSGYATNRAAQFTWFGPYVLAESTWWPGQLVGFHLGIGAAAPFTRGRFYATRPDGTRQILFETAAIVPFLSAGLSLAL